MRLADRIAIVTGAAKGMGRDICLTLAREGAHLTLVARESGPLDTLAREVESLGRRGLAAPTDVTDELAVERMVARARETFGRIDILINAAALHPGIVGGDRMDKLCREKAKKRGWTSERVYQEYVDEMALRRVTVAQDIANAVLFLVSDDASNMTGQSVTVDGGWDV